MLREILTFIAGSTLLLGVIGFIARSVFCHVLDKDLEVFRSRLLHESGKRHLVFERLYEKRLEIISSLYALSVESERTAAYAVSMHGKVPEENLPELEGKMRGFREQYALARLWLDDDCCNIIDNLVDEHSIFYRAVNIARLQEDGLAKGWAGEEYQALWKRSQAELPAAQEGLRRIFQAVMMGGVTESNK